MYLNMYCYDQRCCCGLTVMHEASYIVVMAEFMQVTPITPMTGIEVATQERGTHYKSSSYCWTTVHNQCVLIACFYNTM